MPAIVLTPKQRAFCYKYIETGNASLAYREIYDCSKSKPSSISRKAKELLDNGKIAAMVDEHRSLHRQRHEITVNQLSSQLDEDREFAGQHGHSAAAVSPTMGKAGLFGLLKDRSEITNVHSLSRDGNDVTVEEKGRIITAALGRCANAVASDPY